MIIYIYKDNLPLSVDRYVAVKPRPVNEPSVLNRMNIELLLEVST